MEIRNKKFKQNCGKLPDKWNLGIIIPLFTKGYIKECANYQGISMLSTVSKMYEQKNS